MSAENCDPVHDATGQRRNWVEPVAALLAGIIAWSLVTWLPPVFHVPREYDVPNLGAPAEKFAANRAAQNRADRLNSMLELAIVGSLLAGSIAVPLAGARRLTTRVAVAVPLGALSGAAGALVGSLVRDVWVQTAAQPDLIHAVRLYFAALATLGLGVGLTLGVACGGIGSMLTAGLMAGGLAGILYPVALCVLMPAAETECVIPGESTSQMLYTVLTAVLLGLVLPTAARSQKSTPAAIG